MWVKNGGEKSGKIEKIRRTLNVYISDVIQHTEIIKPFLKY